MKPLQQYFHIVLLIQYAVLTSESVDETLRCNHSNETSSAVLSHGTIYLACSSNFIFYPFRILLNIISDFSSVLTW